MKNEQRMVNVIELERPSEQQVRIGSVELPARSLLMGDGDDRITVRVHQRTPLTRRHGRLSAVNNQRCSLVSAAAHWTFVHEDDRRK